MASAGRAGRAARCCIRSSSGLTIARSGAPASLASLCRAVSTATPPPTSTSKKTTTTPTQKRPAPTAKAPFNRRPASNGNGNSGAKPATPAANNNGNRPPQPPKQTQNPAPSAPLPTVRTSRQSAAQDKAAIDDQSPIKDMTEGLADTPLTLDEASNQVDWSSSFHGLSAQPFSQEAAAILLADIEPDDVEVKPDGIVYLPEIKYRRILNKAFGPGGWGLAPRGETIVTGKSVTREYALVAHGRLVSVARGEQQYFSPEGIPTATEGCKSNALMRCCKDLGVASELWDPRFIRKFMKSHAKQIWVEHVPTKKKKQIWLRMDDEPKYPFKETNFGA